MTKIKLYTISNFHIEIYFCSLICENLFNYLINFLFKKNPISKNENVIYKKKNVTYKILRYKSYIEQVTP